MEVQIEKLTKKWGPVYGAKDVSLEITDGEFVALLGPSGCGKTTTLLMIAGIYKPSGGIIRFDDRVVNRVAPKDRNVGMVFQSYALYPHMTVYQNLSYPLKLKKVPQQEMKERAQRVADMMGIGQLMDRKPAQLSGGQQQRVALGRALVKEPDILLFDEPLSNLDARLRLTMRSEIKRLQLELGITSIYVTHDQVEAMTMADRIAVMKDGKLQAYATPNELYDRPRTLFVASFVGNPPMNLNEVDLRQENGDFIVQRRGLRAKVPAERGEKAAGEATVIMGLRPEDIKLAPADSDEATTQGKVYVVEPLGRDYLVEVEVEDAHFHVLADPITDLKIGDRVGLVFDTQKVQFFDPETERSMLWA